MCKAQITLGPTSFGNADMLSLCDLYRASFSKVNINLTSMNARIIHRLRKNVSGYSDRKKHIDDKIKRSMLYFGELQAMEWVKGIDIKELKTNILSNSTDSLSDGIIRLDILRRCYLNEFYIASDCENMKRINAIIEKCRDMANQDRSWYFVIIFVLLYSKG
eukprot:799580_1